MLHYFLLLKFLPPSIAIFLFAVAPCPDPDVPVYGRLKSRTSTAAEVECLPGYETSDNTRKSCVKGSWVGANVKCRCKFCTLCFHDFDGYRRWAHSLMLRFICLALRFFYYFIRSKERLRICTLPQKSLPRIRGRLSLLLSSRIYTIIQWIHVSRCVNLLWLLLKNWNITRNNMQ